MIHEAVNKPTMDDEKTQEKLIHGKSRAVKKNKHFRVEIELEFMLGKLANMRVKKIIMLRNIPKRFIRSIISLLVRELRGK